MAIINMSTDHQSLLRLMTWLSPVFPTGGFSYSHGLEAAIGDGLVHDKEGLRDWIAILIANGSQWNDCVLLCEAYRQCGDIEQLNECVQLGQAMASSKERLLETIAQGNAFAKASGAWQDFELPDECPLAVAVGALAAKNKIDVEATLVAYLQAFCSNQIQAALRLMKLGQQNGVWLQKDLEETLLQTAKRAGSSTLDDLGSATMMCEIMAMRHEKLESRIFRT